MKIKPEMMSTKITRPTDLSFIEFYRQIKGSNNLVFSHTMMLLISEVNWIILLLSGKQWIEVKVDDFQLVECKDVLAPLKSLLSLANIFMLF